MALYRWIAKAQSSDLSQWAEVILGSTAISIDRDVSTNQQIFARDPSDASIPIDERVSVILSWNDIKQGEAQIEVRSNEPLLKAGTRCELIAKALQQTTLRP
jgi:hypothetical protein